MREPRVLVLMTTYNGHEHVERQVDSILSQRGVEVVVRICDDCSADATLAVLHAIADENPNVEVLCNEHNLGCNANFMNLLYGADADAFDFFAISDQDDVWHPDKLQMAAARINANTSRPELYYAGVNNVDRQGRELGNEYAQYRTCAFKPLSVLLVQNWALGCTTLMNGAMLKLLKRHPISDFGRYYDAWIHAVAACCGAYIYCDIENTYIDRLISGDNLVGLMNEKRSVGFVLKQAASWFVHRDDERARKHTRMAECLREGYAAEMDAEVARIVGDVADREHSAAARRRLFRCKEIVMPTRLKTTWLRWMVLFNRF